MVVNGNFLKLCNMMGNYRNLLSSRIILPMYQPVATLKQTLEEKIGLARKPKRPKTPYLRFITEMRPSFQEKHPTMKLTELTKIMALEWKKADPELKSKLDKEYQVDIEAYRKAKAEYIEHMTPDEEKKIEEAKLEEKKAKSKKLYQKAIKDLGKPKRPAAAFALWASSLGAKRGKTRLAEWQKSMILKWEALPEKEKEVFELKAAETMTEYRKQLKVWEDKMVKIGNHDIVRYGFELNKKQSDSKKPAE